MQGELPAGLAERWNVEKRFARLTVQGAFLVLELDVIVAGGVSENYLLATTELWDRLLQEFLLFPRQRRAGRRRGSRPVPGIAVRGAGRIRGRADDALSRGRRPAGVRDRGSGPCPPLAASAASL